MLSAVWALPFLIALEVIPGDTNAWVKFAIVTLLIGYPYCKPQSCCFELVNSSHVLIRPLIIRPSYLGWMELNQFKYSQNQNSQCCHLQHDGASWKHYLFQHLSSK